MWISEEYVTIVTMCVMSWPDLYNGMVRYRYKQDISFNGAVRFIEWHGKI